MLQYICVSFDNLIPTIINRQITSRRKFSVNLSYKTLNILLDGNNRLVRFKLSICKIIVHLAELEQAGSCTCRIILRNYRQVTQNQT